MAHILSVTLTISNLADRSSFVFFSATMNILLGQVCCTEQGTSKPSCPILAADTAAFFANKGEEEIPFKFNADSVDASTVSSSVHV
jgi:hypothetical protein